ncbi:MAG: L,D-transpeptidase family protein [Planctomycetota bacterium]|nr:L,D-transpeptidase family protein [Planctomycetota bacterium]MDI6787676.1 L,D-transpeptidase family protein [Planctomycetota bacterium]
MKKLLFLIVLVVAGYLVYNHYWKPSQKPTETSGQPTPVGTAPQAPSEKPSGITLYEQGKYKEAIPRLEEEIKENPSETDRFLSYIGWSYEKLDKPDKALKIWERLLKEYPTSIYSGDAHYQVGRRSKKREEKLQHLETAIVKFPESQGAREAGMYLGEYYLSLKDEVNKEYKARNAFSLALKSNLPQEKITEIKGRLTDLNKKLVFSSFRTPDSTIYTVKIGDNLTSISRKFKVEAGGDIAPGHIRRINNLKSATIFPDDKLKILTGEIWAKVNKTNITLTLYINNDFIKEYPVSIGDPNKNMDTSAGTFTIGSKVVHPTWYKKTEDGRKEEVPYGDKRNVLGTRWMGFKESPELGIHGTTNPESIGKKISNGCIRMYNNDVEEVYDLISENTRVVIEE